MRIGWSNRDASAVLGVAEPKVSQALQPAITKIARLWRCDPNRTLRLILAAVDDLDPPTEAEIAARFRALDTERRARGL